MLSGPLRTAAALALFSVGSTVALDARAETPARAVVWRDEWRRFSRFEYAYTTFMIAGVVGLAAVGGRQEPGWRGGVLFDVPVRDALRWETSDERARAQRISDKFYQASFVYPIVDAAAVAWLAHGSGDVAGQMLLMDIETLVTTGFLSFLTNATIGRERPYVRTCVGRDGPDFPSCKSSGQNYSFFSGHTGIAFSAAAVTCAHHRHMALYGVWPLDALGCVAAMASATATAVLRISADKHYATDVATGVALGLASGFGVAALHYRTGAAAPPAPARASALRMLPVPTFSDSAAGMSLLGLF